MTLTPPPAEKNHDARVLHVEGLGFDYPDGTAALEDVGFSVAHGERVALLGPNGAGKSTLILLLDGILMPTRGRVLVDGIHLERSTLREVRSRIGLVFQDPDDQLFMTSVYDDVAFGPLNQGRSREETDTLVAGALAAVGLPDVAHRPGQHLSFGQRKRAALATVLAMHPHVLVLDEPTSNLDPRAKRRMSELLHALETTQLIATHDMDLAWRLCTRAIVLDRGRIVADGPVRDVLTDEDLLEEHGLELPHAARAGAGTISS